MEVECKSAVAPSDVSLPPCSSIGLPGCTKAQYYSELRAIWRVNPGFDGGPLAMEEHLASDQGCALSAAMVAPLPTSQQVMSAVYGLAVLGVLVLFGVVLAIGMEQWTTQPQ